MKVCTVCGLKKPLDNFTINKALKSGLSSFCKSCAAERRKKYHTKNKDQINKRKKENRKKYRDKELAYNKEYYQQTKKRRLEYAAQYRKNNREKLLKNTQKYNATHKKQNKERTQKYRKNNPEKIKQIKANYRKNNPEAVRQHRLTRRSKKAANESFTVLEKEMKKLLTSPCANCGSTENQTIDHIIPISRGGRDSIGNYQTLCKSCNCSKHSKFITEWKMS